MSDQEVDHGSLAPVTEPMNDTPQFNMETDQVDNGGLFSDISHLMSQENEFPDAQAQDNGLSGLEAFADELDQEAEEQERLAREAVSPQPEVQVIATQEAETSKDSMSHVEVAAVDYQDPNAADLDVEMTQPIEETQDTVMQSIEQTSMQGPEWPAPSETNSQMPDAPQEPPRQYDPNSLFVSENDPSPEASPIVPSILDAKPAPQPKKPFSFSRIREFQLNFRRLKAADRKLAGHGSATLLGSAAQLETDPDSFLIGPSGTTVQQAAPDADDDEKFHREACAKYEQLKRHYQTLKAKKGYLTFRQEIELTKIQMTENARKRKRKLDIERACEEEGAPAEYLFPEEQNVNEEDDGEPEYGGEENSRKRRKPDLPRKEFKPISMRDAEMQSMRVMIEANGDLPKRKKREQDSVDNDSQQAGPSTARSSKSKGKGKGKGKGKASQQKGSKANMKPRKTAKEKKAISQGLHQATSLMTSNVFVDQAAADAPEQPGFTSRNRKDALKQLIASVPLESQKAVKIDWKAVRGAASDFTGRNSASPDGTGLWAIKGMKTSLKPYQLLGAAFMRRREGAEEEPRGGLMADQMGLGKTLMMLANIVNGLPPANAPVRTTLLVASPNLLTQWDREVNTHTAEKPGLKVMFYRAGTRLDSNQVFEILRQHDIVLTTYSEVMRSYPKNEPPVECHTTEQKLAWWKETYEKGRGVLHRMQFFRIVLDEAQAIKNHTGRTSIACRALMAYHRWALSGTPILNSLTELYPYFKFLNVPHTGSFKIFKNNYCDKHNPENAERLLLRLNQFMIRRTHSDVMFGAPILKLPRATQVTHWCEFNSIERSIYDIVCHRFAECINTWSSRGELEKSYSNAMVMLLRLRQLTAHVLMLQFVMRDLLEREDIERIREVVRDGSVNDAASAQSIVAIRKQLADLAEEEKLKAQINTNSNHDEEDSVDGDLGDCPVPTESSDALQSDEPNQSGRGFGTEFNFQPFVNSLTTGDSWVRAKNTALCFACHKRPKNPWLTQCKHLICYDCYEDALVRMAEEDKDSSLCNECGGVWQRAIECDPNGELEDSQQDSRPETRSRAKKKKKERARPEQEDIKEDWLSLVGDKVLPSAKTIAIKAQILNWVRENPEVKIIIYTQFLAMYVAIL
jgi:SNF2 family DNA or RNA helicase